MYFSTICSMIIKFLPQQISGMPGFGSEVMKDFFCPRKNVQ